MTQTEPQKRYLHGCQEDIYSNLKNVLKSRVTLKLAFAQPDRSSFSSAQMARDQNWIVQQTQFWVRLLHKIMSLNVVCKTSPPFQNTFFKVQKPPSWQERR